MTSTEAHRDTDARGASAPSSANSAGSAELAFTPDPRIQLLGQLKAARFSPSEHPDDFTRGWNACSDNAVDYAIAALFPLPVPTLTVRFPLDDVSRGLRELAAVEG